MVKGLHLGSAVLLLLSHLYFLFRGLWLAKNRVKPSPWDRLARSLSHLLLPVTVFLGLLLMLEGRHSGLLHPLWGALPLLMIPLVSLGRLLLKKRRALPWFLPVLNLILILGAMITGLLSP